MLINYIYKKNFNGFALLEALIAVAIFSFALLGLVGMQAVAIKNSADAKYRADASYYANQLLAQMWVDRINIASYAYRDTETACATSTTAPAYAAVTTWLADMGNTLVGANALPGVLAAGASSYKPQVVVDSTPLTSKMVTVTVCWKLPNDTQVHNHVATAQINN